MSKKNKLDLLLIAKEMSKLTEGLTKREILIVSEFIKQYAQKATDDSVIDLQAKLGEVENLYRDCPECELEIKP